VTFRELVESTEIDVDGRRYVVRYFQSRTGRGAWRYSCEVVLGADDRIILDEDSQPALESRLVRLVAAMVDGRRLAAGTTAA
jgi:hypothetical protein